MSEVRRDAAVSACIFLHVGRQISTYGLSLELPPDLPHQRLNYVPVLHVCLPSHNLIPRLAHDYTFTLHSVRLGPLMATLHVDF